jgi:hypothetical protein
MTKKMERAIKMLVRSSENVFRMNDCIMTMYGVIYPFDGYDSNMVLKGSIELPIDERIERMAHELLQHEHKLFLDVPDTKEIRNKMRAINADKEKNGEKKYKRFVYYFGDGEQTGKTKKPVFNARWLCSIIENFGVYEIRWTDYKSPIQFIGKNGVVVMLPVTSSMIAPYKEGDVVGC